MKVTWEMEGAERGLDKPAFSLGQEEGPSQRGNWKESQEPVFSTLQPVRECSHPPCPQHLLSFMRTRQHMDAVVRRLLCNDKLHKRFICYVKSSVMRM